MTKKVKKPDNVVFDEETNSYDAALKPYATNVGAPVIEIPDTIAWKNRSANAINRRVKTRLQKIQAEYDEAMQEYEYNRLVLSAKFSFEPVVGETYYLYRRENDHTFLSLIAPELCDFDPVGSFFLNSERIWQKV